MTWAAHRAPPSVVVMTAAPLGAPETPTVDPVAQQRAALAQSRAVRALTGGGSATEEKEPSHGDEGPNVDGGATPGVGDMVQAEADTTTTTDATAPRRIRHRAGLRTDHRAARFMESRRSAPDKLSTSRARRVPAVVTERRGAQRTLMTSVCSALSWKPCRLLSHRGESPATMV